MDDKSRNAGYVYSSSELSRFYGLTIKGIEFYEAKGLVHPERIGEGHVRRFNLADSYRLYNARLLKNCNIGLSETVDILRGKSLTNIAASLETHAQQMRQSLAFQRRVAERMEAMCALMQQVESSAPSYELVHLPGFYRLFLRRFEGPHVSNREESREYCRWNNYLPIATASLAFPLQDCLKPVGDLDTGIGLIMEKADFEMFSLQESNRARSIPGGCFIHTLISGDANHLCSRAWVAPALDYLRSHGYTQTGDALTRMLFVVQQDGQTLRWDEAWFPVQAETA